jgi:hydroxymethylbilane synthase
VIEALRELDPDLTIEAAVVESADSTIMDKSRYVSSIEEQLRSHEIDLAVHSAKDVPGEDVPGLLIVAVPERVDPRDTLLGAESLEDLREGATVGTSSLRRAAQLLTARPDLKIEPLRGNIDTRLGRLTDGDYDAIVLAAAGLARLGIGGDVVQGPLDFITAPGQGCLALQVRDIDLTTTGIVGPLSHTPSQRELIAERAASSGLVASCNTPLGINAVVEHEAAENGKDKITVRGWLGLPDGSAAVEEVVSGLASEAHLLGHLLAQRIRAAGGDDILTQAEEMAA